MCFSSRETARNSEGVDTDADEYHDINHLTSYRLSVDKVSSQIKNDGLFRLLFSIPYITLLASFPPLSIFIIYYPHKLYYSKLESQSSRDMDLEESSDEENRASRKEIVLKCPSVSDLFGFRNLENKPTSAFCKGCSKTYAECRLDRMVKHSISCEKSPREAAVKLQEEYRRVHARKLVRFDSLQNRGKQADAEACLAVLIAKNSLPISIVDSSSFIQLMKELNPKFRVPSKKYFRNKTLPTIAERARSALDKTINEAPDFSLTVEFDGWTSITGMSILAVTLTDHIGISYLLQLHDISELSSTAETLAEFVVATIKPRINSKKLNCIITDEASNYKAARQLIADEFEETQIFEYRCLAHVFNLIGSSISKTSFIKPHLVKLMELINTINRQKSISRSLKRHGGVRLLKIVPTRWYSTANAINSVVNSKQAILKVSRESTVPIRLRRIVGDGDFWDTIMKALPYFNRLASMIGLTESKNSLLSDAFRNLLEYARDIMDREEFDEMNIVAIKAFVTHFARCDLDLLVASYLLNPNHRLEYLTDVAIDRGLEHLVSILLEMGHSEEACVTFVTEFKTYKRVAARRAGFHPDVFKWWDASPLPIAKILGLRMSACHASSANTERIFSSLSRIITPSRNRISLNLVDDLLTISIHEKSKDSVKNASSSPQPQRESSSRPSSQQGSQSTSGRHQSSSPTAEEDVSPQASSQSIDNNEQVLDDEHPLDEKEHPTVAAFMDQLNSTSEGIDEESELYEMDDYVLFKKLIDFNSRPLDNERLSEASSQSEARSSRDRARDILRRSS